MLRPAVALTGLLVLAACSSAPAGSSRDRDRITVTEIEATNVASAYDVVQALRPEFLRSRGVSSVRSGSPETAIVYVDGVRAGGLGELRRVPREQLEEISYMSGSDATTMYGTGHGGGAILVVTKRGR